MVKNRTPKTSKKPGLRDSLLMIRITDDMRAAIEERQAKLRLSDPDSRVSLADAARKIMRLGIETWNQRDGDLSGQGVQVTAFLTLSELVLDLQSTAARPRPGETPDQAALRQVLADPGADLRIRAASLAVLSRGEELTRQAPPLINVAALALEMRPRLTTHQIRPAASRLVHQTDLHSLPGAPPRLLRRPWLAEVHHPDRERLFGDTVCLGGYQLEGRTFLVGLTYPDGALVVNWRPQWGERDLEAALPERERSELIDDVDAHHAWAREAARYAIVLGVLMDAEGAPLRREDERPGRRRGAGGAGDPPDHVIRHLYLEEPRARPGGGGTLAEPLAGDRVADQVDVRGHLKRQPCGPGGSERKWIWIASYEARRWVAPKPARVVVH